MPLTLFIMFWPFSELANSLALKEGKREERKEGKGVRCTSCERGNRHVLTRVESRCDSPPRGAEVATHLLIIDSILCE